MTTTKLTKPQRRDLALIERMGGVAVCDDDAFVRDGRRMNMRVLRNLIARGALIPNNDTAMTAASRQIV